MTAWLRDDPLGISAVFSDGTSAALRFGETAEHLEPCAGGHRRSPLREAEHRRAALRVVRQARYVVDRAGRRHDVERAAAAPGALRKPFAQRIVVPHRRAREQRRMQVSVVAGDAEQRGDGENGHGGRGKERKTNEPFAARADGTALLRRFHRPVLARRPACRSVPTL